jgi:predicted ATP-grasp superfamily ATP-dependent carboligase
MIVFFGVHSKEWSLALNAKNLHQFFKQEIRTCTSIEELKEISNAIIIPLLEKHNIELHFFNIKSIFDYNNTILFMNKKLFFEYTINNNLEEYIPKTNCKNENNYYIVKELSNNGGKKIYFTNKFESVCLNTYVVQEYIFTEYEYTIHLVCKEGKIVASITYVFERKNKIRTFRENKNISKISIEDKYLKIFEKFLIPCKYSGICNIDFIIVDNNIKIFEINPRLGGTLMLSQNRKDLVEILSTCILLQ